MASIVGGFLMPHNPMLAIGRGMADPAQEKTVFDAFSTIAARVADLKADTVIVIGDDHFTNFGPHCIPSYLIGIGDVEGPVEPFLGIQRAPIDNHEPLANHILQSGWAEGVDWSFARSLTVDHSVAIPWHLAVRPVPGLRTIPVYLNAGVTPLLPNRRAFQIGQSIARAVASWSGDERVVIYGTGGISHWVGSPGMGRVNAELDARILALCAAGDVEELIGLPDAMVEAEGGNGCLEIKNWLCAMGAMAGSKAELIAYEAMQAWITGMGFAELKSAA